MSEKNVFEVAEERKSLYEREIEALRRKYNMPVEKDPESNDVWIEVCNKGYEWQLGMSLTGVLISKDEETGYSKLYTIETSPGNKIDFYGSAVLDSKLKKIPVGSVIRITYLGESKSEKGRTYKDFKVEVKK